MRVKKIRLSAELLYDMLRLLNGEDGPEENIIPEEARLIKVAIEEYPPTISQIEKEMPREAMKEIVLYIADQEFSDSTLKNAPTLMPALNSENRDRMIAYIKQAFEDKRKAEKMAYMLNEEDEVPKPPYLKPLPHTNHRHADIDLTCDECDKNIVCAQYEKGKLRCKDFKIEGENK